ncbi:carboxynorspermidine decarboxylase [Brevifollis gellanilyticus]|uniref:Carboxynorspermidine/carboxyspermidine decarboxylase n=1 Tax=Brevifollis gellanilyticus TaxID=748831 RepID=A0A512M5V5_9BACT|nr:carboxynorspermidine decarboxylase [Brevifollis gellanilyticus]GEP42123.1 carboxynorspermidine decarboxylase [Brevifollis gellanilyticus]
MSLASRYPPARMAPTPPHVFEQPAPAFDVNAVETPAYVVDRGLLKRNLEKLAYVQRESGAKILLALKGFSMFSTFDLVREYLHGCCSSGLHEALLGHEEFRKELHVYAPAFKQAEMETIIPISHHISFNSPSQWKHWKPLLDAARAAGKHAPSPGIRVNPEHSEVEVSLYDPGSPSCRLGTCMATLEDEDLTGLEGLHFHALCEQDSDVLERTLAAVEKRFPKLLAQVQWVNMGGGHHITRKDYDVERLIRVIRSFIERHGKEVYLEPGEAVALNTGYLIASVMDIVPTEGLPTAILDCSATAHMPDTLEMPYRPHVLGTDVPGALPHSYRLGGMTCLAGDVVNEYSFPEPLKIGQKLVFTDMAHYTMVKTSTFNGVVHPDIDLYDPETGVLRVVRRFGYEDFKRKLS